MCKDIEISVTFDVVLVYLEIKKAAAEVAAELFSLLKDDSVHIDSLHVMPLRRPTSGLSFSVEDGDFSRVLKITAQLKSKSTPMQLTVSGGYAKIVLSGNQSPYGFFQALTRAQPETICLSATEAGLSALVPMADLDKMLAELEATFPHAQIIYRLRDAQD